MPELKQIKRKTLKTLCYEATGKHIAELCRELRISRQTAYAAFRRPELFPIAAPKLFRRLGL
jgi:hypothetical protein